MAITPWDDDRALLAACRAGDAAAWEALIRRDRRLIYSVPVAYRLPVEQADEVFQRVTIKLFEHVSRLVTAWRLTGLAPGTYTWSVRAVDAAFRGGPAGLGTFTMGPVTPPAVPDGRQGTPLRAAKLDPTGSMLEISWDTTTCSGAAGYHIVWGFRSQLPSNPDGTFSIDGSACGIDSVWTWASSPDPSPDPARLLWFLIIADDGSNTEGSWGLDDRGVERTGPAAGGASGVCGMSGKSLANGCGR